MAQELKAYEAYVCHNEFSQDELPQKKDAIVKSASPNEEDDWWDYATEIECYRKSEVDAAIAEKDKEIRRLQRSLWIARADRAKERKFHFGSLDYLGISFVSINFESARIWMTCKIEEPGEWAGIFETVERKCRAKAEEYK